MSTPSKRLSLAVIIGIVFILLILTKAASPLATVLSQFFTPLQRQLYRLSQNVFPYLKEKETIIAERDTLVRKLAAAAERERVAEACLTENAALKELLAYKRTSKRPVVAVQVIGFANSDGTRVLLDQGAEANIRQGDPLIVGDGVLVGRVISASRNRSVAALLTDPSTSVAVLFPTLPGVEALLVAKERVLRLDLLPHDARVVPGMPIVTSGADVRIPRNLVVGHVKEVGTEDRAAPWQNATVEPLVYPLQIMYAGVLLNEEIESSSF